MKNLKISTRLSGAFALLVLMLVGLAVAAMAQLSSMRAATVEITENWLPSIEVVNAIDAEAAMLRLIVLNHIMSTDDAARAKIDQQLIAGREKMVQLRKKYEALISSPEEKSCTTNLPAIGPRTSRSITRRWPIHAKTRATKRGPLWKVNLPSCSRLAKRFWTSL